MSNVASVSKELIDAFIKNCHESVGWELVEDQQKTCSRGFYLLFGSITEFLGKVKDTTKRVGIVVEDEKGVFQFGAYVDYNKVGEDDEAGSWSYVFTFDPNELTDAKTYRTSNDEFKQIAVYVAVKSYGYAFIYDEGSNDEASENNQKKEIVFSIIAAAAKAVRIWVEENSISVDPRSTEIEGMVIIEAALSDDGNEKVFSITPSGALKNAIKDDCMVENQDSKEVA